MGCWWHDTTEYIAIFCQWIKKSFKRDSYFDFAKGIIRGAVETRIASQQLPMADEPDRMRKLTIVWDALAATRAGLEEACPGGSH